jgi:hypothetical protein
MKRIAIFIAAWQCLAPLSAQMTSEKRINYSGKESLSLNIEIADSIDILTWNKNEVYAVASVNINDNKDNEAYQIAYDEAGPNPRIKAGFKKDFFKGRKNCCTESDIRWRVYIPEKAKFMVETINGNITVRGTTGEMKVKSISGFIDLAVPKAKSADVEFSTVTGTVYTNLDLPFNKGSHEHSSKFESYLNGGGIPIELETVSGDIFFRKSD